MPGLYGPAPPFGFVRRKAAGPLAERQTDQHQRQRDEGRAPEVDSRERQRALPDRSRRCEDARRGSLPATMLLGHLRHGDHAADHDRPRRSYGRIERRAGGRSFGRVRVLHRVRILPRVRSHDRVRSRMRRRRCVTAASAPLALQRVHIHLMPARTGRSLVWLAITRPVQHRARRSAVSLRDLPGRLAVAVELRFVGRRSRVRVVRRVVRRLHTRLSRAHLLCSVRNGWSGHRRCRSFVLLQLTRRVRRVAVALRRVRHGCRSNRRIVFAVSLAVAVTGERRSGRQSSDAEYEHAGAHEPQFHVSPSFPSLVLLPASHIRNVERFVHSFANKKGGSRPPFSEEPLAWI